MFTDVNQSIRPAPRAQSAETSLDVREMVGFDAEKRVKDRKRQPPATPTQSRRLAPSLRLSAINPSTY